jgi:hypothetical protein
MSLIDHQFDLTGYCLDDNFDLAQYGLIIHSLVGHLVQVKNSAEMSADIHDS